MHIVALGYVHTWKGPTYCGNHLKDLVVGDRLITRLQNYLRRRSNIIAETGITDYLSQILCQTQTKAKRTKKTQRQLHTAQ
jgi:hypothetical protein